MPLGTECSPPFWRTDLRHCTLTHSSTQTNAITKNQIFWGVTSNNYNYIFVMRLWSNITNVFLYTLWIRESFIQGLSIEKIADIFEIPIEKWIFGGCIIHTNQIFVSNSCNGKKSSLSRGASEKYDCNYVRPQRYNQGLGLHKTSVIFTWGTPRKTRSHINALVRVE